MVFCALSEGRWEGGPGGEQGEEVGFWGLVFSDEQGGPDRAAWLSLIVRARIESRAVFLRQYI